MEGLLKERFIKTYANVPLSLRDEIVLILQDGALKKPITWNVAYLEVNNDSVFAEQILKGLDELKVI